MLLLHENDEKEILQNPTYFLPLENDASKLETELYAELKTDFTFVSDKNSGFQTKK